MKRTLLFSFILLFAISTLAQSPVAWYPLHGNANDSTGNGHNGTLVNNPVPTADQNTNPNSAYHFNGSNQYISIPYDSAFNIPPNGQFTISLWLYSDTTNSNPRALFIKSPSNTAWDYGMYLFTNNRIMIGHNGVHTGWSKTQIIQKQWYCVTGTYNNGDYKIYINGVLDSAVINSGKYITQSTGGLAIAVKGQSLINYFPGSLDNVAFYNVALSDSQIAAMACNSSLLTPPPQSNFASSDSAFCSNAGKCISFYDHSTGNPTSWAWSFPGATPSSSSDQNPQNICYSAAGIYDVTLKAANSGGTDSITFSNYINVFPPPPAPVITQKHDTLLCITDTSYTGYQWYSDSTLITGATDTFLVITQGGIYNISVGNANGCNNAVGATIVLGNFTTSDSSFCSNTGKCISFFDHSTGNPTSWAWSFPGATPSSSSDQNPQNICYSTAGIYDVTLIAGNLGRSDSITFSNYINVFPPPPAPVITQKHDTLFCSTDTSYTGYQWYSDTTLIAGATDTFLVITQGGNYGIAVGNALGCNNAMGAAIILGNFATSDSAFCSNDGKCISFSDYSTGSPITWNWSFPGAFPSSSSDQNPQNICYPNAGVYDVTLVAGNSGGSDSITFTNYIDVFPSPATPLITLSHDTLFCKSDSSYIGYQWYNDSTIIPGATDTFLVITQSGNYNISVGNAKGCNIAVGVNIVLGISSLSKNDQLIIYPNPSNDKLQIIGLGMEKKSALLIYNVLGEKVLSFNLSFGEHHIEPIDISALAKGVYFIELYSGIRLYKTKLLVE